MNTGLFTRLKKLAAEEEKVIIVDGDEAFVLMSLSAYEKGQERRSGAEGFFLDNEPRVRPKTDDEELMKKVNLDIAEWRAKEEEKKEKKDAPAAVEEPKTEETALTEEERYYLEPLE